MNKKFIVRLTAEERTELSTLIKKGKTAAHKIKHANIMLKVDADGSNWSDSQAAEAFSCSENAVRKLRQRFVEHGFEMALDRKKQCRPSNTPMVDGEKEARLIAIACGSPLEGRARWTLHLLADKAVELKIFDSISHETVRQTLKKMN